MKAIYTVLILISNLIVFAQSENVIGNYAVKIRKTDYFDYKLTLNQDGSFVFHYYSNIKQGIPPEVNKYGKGKWTVENNVISFFADKEDIDDKHVLNFNNSKAKFLFKSARDKSDRLIQTRLKFLESELFWMYKIELLKI